MTNKTDKVTANIKHPFRDYDTTEALSLATNLKYGILHRGLKETPGLDEAISLFENCATMKSCNWITGQIAVQVLKAAKGEEVVWT
jgi:hypothetical protein